MIPLDVSRVLFGGSDGRNFLAATGAAVVLVVVVVVVVVVVLALMVVEFKLASKKRKVL